MRMFLTLKSWQLFLLLVLPMFVPMLGLSSPNIFVMIGIMSFIWAIILIAWLYTVGSASNDRLPDDLKLSSRLFKVAFGVPALYLFLQVFVIFPSVQGRGPGELWPIWVVPIHLLSMLGMFYGLWFTAKQFVTLQRGKKVTFIEYSGPFFLFWFAPIGVWFLQPQINKVLGNTKE